MDAATCWGRSCAGSTDEREWRRRRRPARRRRSGGRSRLWRRLLRRTAPIRRVDAGAAQCSSVLEGKRLGFVEEPGGGQPAGVVAMHGANQRPIAAVLVPLDRGVLGGAVAPEL